MKEIYKAYDGKEFEDSYDCCKYEFGKLCESKRIIFFDELGRECDFCSAYSVKTKDKEALEILENYRFYKQIEDLCDGNSFQSI